MTPTPASRSLFARACGVAQALGLALAEERRGGVSDANWLMYAGVPTLDGLGPVGDLDFTEDEYIVKESLFERIELTAHLLLSLHERPL
jgi:glutamate carboxypeptidase